MFRNMVDVQFVAAMGPAGGGRNSITGRYLRHFNLVSIVDVADNVLAGIFDTILKWYLKDTGFVREAQDMSGKIIEATLQVRAGA